MKNEQAPLTIEIEELEAKLAPTAPVIFDDGGRH